MESEVIAPVDTTKITGIPFVSVYVDDFSAACTFYHEVLGLQMQFDMGSDSCFFTLGSDVGLYLEGNNNQQELRRDTVRSSFTLGVRSAFAMYAKLKSAGVRMVHDEPMDMGQGDFWFQFYDPAGNILEALGGR